MGKKINKKEVNRQLLHSIFTLQEEYQYMQSIVRSSLDTGGNISHRQKLAEAKYLFLLKEARLRNVSVFQH